MVTTPTGTVLREYLLRHDYSIGGRLTLISVAERDRNETSLPPTTLAYEAGDFPARTSKAQDHFGYYNGKTANVDLIPGAMTPAGLWLPGADRDADVASARIGALTRITYPTGGYNEFVFELHDYGAVGTNDSPPAGSGPPQSANAAAGFNEGSVTSPFTVGGMASVPVTVTVGMDPACGPQIGCPYVEIVGAGIWSAPGTYTVTLAPGTYTLHAAEEMIGGFASIAVSWRDWIVQPKKPAGGSRALRRATQSRQAYGRIQLRTRSPILPPLGVPMNTASISKKLAILGLFVTASSHVIGCNDRTRTEGQPPSGRASRSLPDTVGSLQPARTTVDRYLYNVREGAKRDTATFNELHVCDLVGSVATSLWVATHRILDVERRGDSVVVGAVVVSVAAQRESDSVANQFVVEPGIRVDTLHWVVVETPQGRVGICGYSRESIDLGSYGRPENTHYLHGSSRARLLRAADSVRAASRTP